MSSNRTEARFGALQYDLMKERASALGTAGRQVQESLSALRAASREDKEAYERLLWAAAKCVWRYFVQREACGMREHDGVIEDYEIPKQVLARVGARAPESL